MSWMISMSKSNTLALTFLFVAATAFSVAGCRSGGNAAPQAFGPSPVYSQGSGTANAPSYNSGGSGSTNSYGGGSYGGGGSGSTNSYSGGSGAR